VTVVTEYFAPKELLVMRRTNLAGRQPTTKRSVAIPAIATLLAFSLTNLGLATAAESAANEFDVVVVGGTPGGIAAAVSAARHGRTVALVEYHGRIGGMSTSGLGKSDIENRAMIQGLFREFVDRVKAHYLQQAAGDENSELVKACRDGYYYEPSVAEKVFESFLAEQPKVTVLKNHRLVRAITAGGRVSGVELVDRKTGETKTLRSRVTIDATYEGDVYASAGADFRIGREGRSDFGEPHAGEISLDWRHRTAAGASGSGEGDRRLQTYSYRLCLTTDPKNAVPLTAPPADYDRTRYLGYLDDYRSGRFGTRSVTQICFSIAGIPNGKTDVNMNPRGLGFVFVGENVGYIDADWNERERIATHIRNLTLGLLWFLQNDDEVPADAKELARNLQLCRDEFVENGHFPPQLYVREGRRLVGEYTLTEHDITKAPGRTEPTRHADAIAVGEFPIDSFPVQKRRPQDTAVLEGYLCMLADITRPYHIPYRIMVPAKLDGLLAPVAASTTHVAFSSIRMEPTWMALGQAAGDAAYVALERGVELRDVPIGEVQALLRKQGAVLDLPGDAGK
jgi:hypothetical protein